MKRLCLALLAALSALGVCADEHFPTLQVGGVIYTNVTVTSHNASEIFFRHAGGLNNARLCFVSKEIQQQYNYDPVAARALEKRRENSGFTYQLIAAQNAAIRAGVARENSIETTPRAKPAALSDPCSESSLLGKLAPAITIEKWFTEPAPADEAKARLFVFYTATSEPCRRALPALNDLAKRFADQLQVIGITTDSAPSEAGTNDTVTVSFPHGSDPKGLTAQLAGITSLPAVMLITPNRIVHYTGHPAALNDETFAKIITPQD
ncbi:MAG: hypothetical protein RL380_298 [Verrucomicrobiota bacterium]